MGMPHGREAPVRRPRAHRRAKRWAGAGLSLWLGVGASLPILTVGSPARASTFTATASLAPAVESGAGLGVEISAPATGIGAFKLTLTPATPAGLQLSVPSCPPAFATCTYLTDPTTGGVTVQGSGGSGLSASGELAFIPVRITAPVTSLAVATLTFQQLTDTTGAAIGLPSPVTAELQRGAVADAASGWPTAARPLTQADATAALQYLVGLLPAGTASGEVNPVNLAALLPPGSALPETPGPANVVTLLQYLAGQRDANLATIGAAQAVTVSASVSGNLLTLALNPPVPGLGLPDVTLVDAHGQPVAPLDMVTTDGGSTYQIGAYLTPGATYTVGLALPGFDFGAPVAVTVPGSTATAGSASVGAASPEGFDVTLSSPIATLSAADIALQDGSGDLLPVQSLQTFDGGATWVVAATLAAGQTYSLSLTVPNWNFGAPLTVAVPQATSPVPVSVAVYATSTGGFLMGLTPPVPDLTAPAVTVTDSEGNPVPLQSVAP